MARPRTPLAKAEITGRTLHDPKRFKDRAEPKSYGPLGPPPKWMTNPWDKLAWNTFRDELPWLNKSHRALVEIAASLRGRIVAGEEVGIKAYTLLRMCLASMGASPSDSSKVSMPDATVATDPADKYFAS